MRGRQDKWEQHHINAAARSCTLGGGARGEHRKDASPVPLTALTCQSRRPVSLSGHCSPACLEPVLLVKALAWGGYGVG